MLGVNPTPGHSGFLALHHLLTFSEFAKTLVQSRAGPDLFLVQEEGGGEVVRQPWEQGGAWTRSLGLL